MGIWKERGLEVERSSRVDAKPCRHLNVYVSGRLDVHRPSDPPRQGGRAIVMARFLFAQNPMKKTSFSFASPSASQVLSVSFIFTKTLLAFGCVRLSQ